MRTRWSALVVIALVLASACSGVGQASPPLDDTGLSVADHSGSTLVIATLDPGSLGDNAVRVFLRDTSGTPVGGSAHVSLRRGGAEVGANYVAVGAATTLAIPAADSYELVVEARPDGQPPGVVRFPLTLPAKPPDATLLERVDAAMNTLRGLRESQTLTSGTFTYVFSYDYQAPDRIRYSFVRPDGALHETVVAGPRRFDREGQGSWTRSDLGAPLATASFSFAAAPRRVRQIGTELLDGRQTLVLALITDGPPYERYYRLWIDAVDLRVRRYTMMATGHYMGGTYRDFNAQIEIPPPR